MAAAAVAGSPTQSKPSARELQERVAAIQQKAMSSVRPRSTAPALQRRALAAAAWAPRRARDTSSQPRDGGDTLRKRARRSARCASARATGSARPIIRRMASRLLAIPCCAPAPLSRPHALARRVATTQGLLDEQFTQLQQLQDDDNPDFLEEARARLHLVASAATSARTPARLRCVCSLPLSRPLPCNPCRLCPCLWTTPPTSCPSWRLR